MRARAIVAFGFALLFALPAHADEAEEPGRLAAVQKRKFRLDHEIFAGGNFQPLDAFFKGVGPVASYTIHFSDVVGWELIRGGYSFNLKTSLRDQLEKDFGVEPTRFEEMEWMTSTALMYTPFYGKMSMLNRSVLHSELYFVLGGTVGKFNDRYKPGPQVGMGLRFFLSESVSLRAEGRYHYLIGRDIRTQLLDLSLGLAFNLGGTD